MAAKRPSSISSKRQAKVKRTSSIARGRLAKTHVFRGHKAKTSGGLEKKNLSKNKSGKIVSKRRSARGKQAYKHIKPWAQVCAEARDDMELKAARALCMCRVRASVGA